MATSAAAPAGAAGRSVAQATMEEVATHPATVVVIEDDSNIAQLVELYLRDAGYGVHLAGDGSTGIDLVRARQPNLVVLDIGLPGALDGLEVCRQLRATSRVPIVVVTARDTELDRVLGLELGADDYVTKPFSPASWWRGCALSCAGPTGSRTPPP